MLLREYAIEWWFIIPPLLTNVSACMREGQRSSLWTFATDRFCSEPPTFARRRHMPVAYWKDNFWVHVSLGSAQTLVRRGGIINHHSIAYFPAKNYWNRLMWVESIVCNISVVFLGYSVVPSINIGIQLFIQWLSALMFNMSKPPYSTILSHQAD